jgi:folylpolyglutamate synthase/dihydropteroate synthase
LEETKNEISVYFFDQTKFKPSDLAIKTDHEKNLEILTYFKKKRNFISQEIELAEFIKPSEAKNLDDVFFHVRLLKEINSRVLADTFVLSDDLSFFSNQIKSLELIDSFKSQNLSSCELLAPFSNLNPQEISQVALSEGLDRFNEINFGKLYTQNKNFIDCLKTFDEKKDKLDKLVDDFTCYDAILRNLLEKQRLVDCELFAKFYGDRISKEVIIYALSNLITFNPGRETLITHLVAMGELSNKEINEALVKLVKRYSYYREATKSQADEIDYFFRLYDYKITEEAKDQMMWDVYSVRFVDFYHELILEKLIDWGCDVGDLLLRSIDGFGNDKKENCATTLLTKYGSKISNLQLNEALLKAFNFKLYSLCKKLIAAGADKTIIQFHSHSYGYSLWVKNRNKEITANRNYWRKKDRVIIHEILKELGNPQDKVPPVIHVTGSNGKGSTCAFLRSILEQNGYSAHVLTSPSIVRDNENFIIAGKEILDQQYYDYLSRAEAAFNKIKDKEDFKEKIAKTNKEEGLTEDQIKEDNYLDWSFIIPAITLAFAENKADVTIVEVVTGGENDVTNIFSEQNTIATIINTIIFGDNHTTTFGSIEGAAETKSRLAKNGVPVLSVLQEDAVEKVIRKIADEKSCQLYFAGNNFTVKEFDESHFFYQGFGKSFKLQKPKLAGGFQIANAAISLSALLVSGRFNLEEAKISTGIRNAYHTGRFMEIDNFKIDGYERVWFGTTKLSKLTQQAVPIDSDLIQTPTEYPDHFTGSNIGEIFLCHKKIILVNRGSDNLILGQKLSGLPFYDKKYLSSAIRFLNFQKKASSLIIKTTGIQSFPKNYLQLLKQLKQTGFLPDLEFAKQHKLLDEDLASLIS